MTTEAPILNDADGDGNQHLYTPEFRNEFEYLIPTILNQRAQYRTIEIEQSDRLQAEGDFYRICAKKSGLNRAYWWYMLRINGMYSPTDFTGDRMRKDVLVPMPDYIDSLLQIYLTNNQIRL